MNMSSMLYIYNNYNGRIFPKNVFSKKLKTYLFFDIDILFSEQFSLIAKNIIKYENSNYIYMINLDENEIFDPNMNFMKFDSQTTCEEYIIFLNGKTISEGWSFKPERFSFSSDANKWIIYCERMNDLAVIAMDESLNKENYSFYKEEFNAKNIKEIVNEDIYPFNKLIPLYRDGLVKNY